MSDSTQVAIDENLPEEEERTRRFAIRAIENMSKSLVFSKTDEVLFYRYAENGYWDELFLALARTDFSDIAYERQRKKFIDRLWTVLIETESHGLCFDWSHDAFAACVNVINASRNVCELRQRLKYALGEERAARVIGDQDA